MALAKIYDDSETLMVPIDVDKAIAMSKALSDAVCLVKGAENIMLLTDLESAIDDALTAAGIDW